MKQLIVLFLLAFMPYAYLEMLAGGIGNTIVPTSQDDPSVQQITAQSVQEAFKTQTRTTPSEFFVVSYASQVVAGTNFFAKVRYGPNEYAHIRVYVALPHTNKEPELHSYQLGKSLQDPIEYFDKTEAVTEPETDNDNSGDSSNSSVTFDWSVFALFFLTVLVFFAK